MVHLNIKLYESVSICNLYEFLYPRVPLVDKNSNVVNIGTGMLAMALLIKSLKRNPMELITKNADGPVLELKCRSV